MTSFLLSFPVEMIPIKNSALVEFALVDVFPALGYLRSKIGCVFALNGPLVGLLKFIT